MAAFGRVLRDVDDLAAPAVGHWTARDVAAHVAGGFEPVGEQVDEEDGLEIVYERPAARGAGEPD